mgnify:FL=1
MIKQSILGISAMQILLASSVASASSNIEKIDLNSKGRNCAIESGELTNYKFASTAFTSSLDFNLATDTEQNLDRVRKTCKYTFTLNVPYGQQLFLEGSALGYIAKIPPSGLGQVSLRVRETGKSSEGKVVSLSTGTQRGELSTNLEEGLALGRCGSETVELEAVVSATVRANPESSLEKDESDLELGNENSNFSALYLLNTVSPRGCEIEEDDNVQD